MAKTNIHALIFIVMIIIILSACANKSKNAGSEQETPKALQESKLDIISYSRSGDNLAERLYEELAAKSPELKKLEDDIEKLADSKNRLINQVAKYDGKSDSYYNSAGNIANSVSDSLLRKRISSMVSISKNKFIKTTAELNSLTAMILQEGIALNDAHSVLKIILTLPLIEKYQEDKMPGNNEFKELIKEEGNIIARIKKLTPEY